MEIIAKARFVRSAPQKFQVLSSVIKKKTIDEAIDQLQNFPNLAANHFISILDGAKNQIKDKNVEISDFKISEIRVNEGPKLKRRRIRHQGRATTILKRMSHITVVLSDEPKSKIKDQKSKREKMK